ncbi:dTDP-4-amino-4,6-dideoxygalactose transaminase [Falsibacillus pallidus]|uniref:dTDP-4-amino-4,6-dideoxygalactose transaminase n=1 Tax=Falsibacillus pallidus TaxID=493781 RepID=A0A370G8I6_9BACI|nr:dTDP-4-amino-4,6-dideoxygalactose transaminase [Falsibacillus pallidus]RDI40105.1 dTDP-4-amino-4,6-dideoxygalactose transaminase [Falsibacillus pallidus]
MKLQAIPFNVPLVTGRERTYVEQVISSGKFSGDQPFTKLCSEWLEQKLGCQKALLTPSCTHSLEMAAILANIGEGDEVIMPSYTFVSTANAFVLRGAKIVFVDIEPQTMNIDSALIENAVTERTKAIVVVHYGGVSCEMETIMELARKHSLLVIEDAAQALMAEYKGNPLGTIGDIGCLSFHETKNYHCGEGGALLINRPVLVDRAEIIREKGTNRSRFFRGQIDKYTWVDIGSSYLMNELSAAFLYAQLEEAEKVNEVRKRLWVQYREALLPLVEKGWIEIAEIPEGCSHNAHLFFLKAKDLEERSNLIAFLKKAGIGAVFHYIPLHSTEIGRRVGRFHGEDLFTTKESERLVRLPMYYGLKQDDIEQVVKAIRTFYEKHWGVKG